MKKKLLFITQALWVGGIESALLNLLRALDGEAYDISCLILQNNTQLAHRLPENCRLLVADRAEAGQLWLRNLAETPENPSRLHRACAWLRPLICRADAWVYLRYLRRKLAGERFHTAVIYSDAAALAAKAVQAETWLSFYHHGAMRKAPYDGAVYRKSAKIVTVSLHQAVEMGRFRPEFAQKIHPIHNLTDAAWVRHQAVEFTPDFDPGQFHIVTCGRLHRDKGMDLAVEACARLAALKNLHWWIIGGGPEERALRRLIAEGHLEKRITLLGQQENPYPYIAACDLYVQPSRVEGYPMSILEALILEKAVLSTDNPGGREVLAGGRFGLLCEISPEGIAAGVAGFLGERPVFEAFDASEENRRILRQLEEIL